MRSALRIGVDFDNTIVCYDHLFHSMALADGLIPAALPVDKTAVRDHLRRHGREGAWTELQGRVYGVRLQDAPPFPGVLAFFRRAVRRGIPVFIVSHKTRHPVAGPRHDLHRAALDWLSANGFFDGDRIGLQPCQVFLEVSRGEKLARIAALACTAFVDDLPELLTDPQFPAEAERLLFDPESRHAPAPGVRRFRSWAGLSEELLTV